MTPPKCRVQGASHRNLVNRDQVSPGDKKQQGDRTKEADRPGQGVESPTLARGKYCPQGEIVLKR